MTTAEVHRGALLHRARARGADEAALRFLDDTPIRYDDEDRLGYAAYADALAELLDHPSTSTPLTVAITGPWGSGKTSLAQMVEERLKQWPRQRGEDEHITCWFNAWLHNDAPTLGAAFAAEVARVAEQRRSPIARLTQPLPARMLSVRGRLWRRLSLALLTTVPLALGLLALTRGDAGDTNRLEDIAHGLGYETAFGITAALVVLFGVWSQLSTVATSAARFVTDPAGEAARGSLGHVRSQLGRLIHQATNRGRTRRRLVIFVDDLERCDPSRAVDVCEKAHQLFGHRDVAIVLLADIAPLAAAAAAKHDAVDEGYGERFLQKMVQVQFDVPAVTPVAMRVLLGGRSAEATKGAAAAGPAPSPVARTPIRTRSRVRGLAGQIPAHPWWALAGAFAAFIGWSVVSTWLPSGVDFVGSLLLFLLIFVFLLLGLVRTGMQAVAALRRWRSRRASAEVDRRIGEAATGAETDGHELVEKVLRDSYPASAPLVDQRVNRYLADASDARRAAEEELFRHPPRLPRNAKRVLNQLRVVIVVALRRGLLAPGTGITPAHIGRWVVLQEHWPTLGRVLVNTAGLGARLESCATADELSGELSQLGVPATDAPGMLQFLHTEPRLSPFLDHIVRYSPSPQRGGSADRK